MNKYAIIVAGGSGTRMNSEIPKQFIEVYARPILMHTLERFHFDGIQIILVLNVDFHDYWARLCKKYNFNIPHLLVKGGDTRYQSVKNGLAQIHENALVAVHDAVRPFIKQSLISNAFEEASIHGTAVLAIPLKDSIRKKIGEFNIALNREDYVLIQTPQIFKSDILKKAYQEPFRNEFTDDASVVEFMSHKIHLVEGDPFNIKVTYPNDLKIIEALMKIS
jgi:2-C-methyl-D-erythritol 4-phosphate cytidylyltransferase